MDHTNICDIKHKRVDERLDGHDDRLNNHSERIKVLENSQVKTETIVQNVCKQIGTLVQAIWWGFGLVITSLAGFFIWYIQSLR